MHFLIIINDTPYGTERCYNALRLATALLKRSEENQVTVFLMADAVGGAQAGQKTPDGFFNIERMLKGILTKKGRSRVLLCGTCMDARGMTEDHLMSGPERSTMDELAEVTANADQVLGF